jgi:hypothetical protein
MAGIYEALLQADLEQHSSHTDASVAEPGEPMDDHAALGAMVRRLHGRVESELEQTRDEGFEHFAALEVSIGAIEDRLDHEDHEQGAATADLAESVGHLVAEVGALSSRIDHELPLLRAELIHAIKQRPGSRRGRATHSGAAPGILAGLYWLFVPERLPTLSTEQASPRGRK